MMMTEKYVSLKEGGDGKFRGFQLTNQNPCTVNLRLRGRIIDHALAKMELKILNTFYCLVHFMQLKENTCSGMLTILSKNIIYLALMSVIDSFFMVITNLMITIMKVF